MLSIVTITLFFKIALKFSQGYVPDIFSSHIHNLFLSLSM